MKVMVTGGASTPGSVPHESQFDLNQLRIIMQEARDAGLPCTAHAWGAEGIADAVEAGFDGIEHCGFFVADGPAIDPTVVEAMRDRGVWASVTCMAWRPDRDIPAIVLGRLDWVRRVTEYLVAAGVTVAVSSDGGVAPSKPHHVLPFAAQVLRSLGFPGEDALAAMTTVAAKACGLGHRKGATTGTPDEGLLLASFEPRRDRTPDG